MKITTQNNKLIANGKEIKLYGVNMVDPDHIQEKMGIDFHQYAHELMVKSGLKINCVRIALLPDQGRNPNSAHGMHGFIESCKEKGIYVIIDYHRVDAWGKWIDDCIEWNSRVAELFGHHENVIFEIFNEPIFVASEKWLAPKAIHWINFKNELAEPVIQTIRDYSDNLIICGSPDWSGSLYNIADAPLDDYDDIAYSLHLYSKHIDPNKPESSNIADRLYNLIKLSEKAPVIMTETGFQLGDDIEGGNKVSQTELLYKVSPYLSGLTAWCYSPLQTWRPTLINKDYTFKTNGVFWRAYFDEKLVSRKKKEPPVAEPPIKDGVVIEELRKGLEEANSKITALEKENKDYQEWIVDLQSCLKYFTIPLADYKDGYVKCRDEQLSIADFIKEQKDD